MCRLIDAVDFDVSETSKKLGEKHRTRCTQRYPIFAVVAAATPNLIGSLLPRRCKETTKRKDKGPFDFEEE